ncbi:hypothetical protein KGY73_10805 [bacterium]|nr:hypothetical protein [bacterium]
MKPILLKDGSCHGISSVRPRSTHPPVGPLRCGRAAGYSMPPILYKKESNIPVIEPFSLVVGGGAAMKNRGV